MLFYDVVPPYVTVPRRTPMYLLIYLRQLREHALTCKLLLDALPPTRAKALRAGRIAEQAQQSIGHLLGFPRGDKQAGLAVLYRLGRTHDPGC